MIRSSFSGINTARLAAYASQNGIQVTGQNISNARTPGYSRQQLNQASLSLSGNFRSPIPEAHIGYGVQVTGISQIRDPYLDSRYRNQMSNLGEVDRQLEILKNLEDVLDDADKEALASYLGEMKDMLGKLQDHVGEGNYDNMVRSAAQKVTDMLNLYSKQLGEARTDAIEKVNGQTGDINNLNSILEQIAEMNKQITMCQSNGNPALELQDERNMLIDSLSTYGKIKVTNSQTSTMHGASIDNIKIEMQRADGTYFSLIDGSKAPAKFEFNDNSAGGVYDYEINVTPANGGTKINDIKLSPGVLSSSMDMLNQSGQFDTPASKINGIGYYQKMMDTFAQTFAQTLNAVNGGGANDLFGTKDGSPVVNAGNITISAGWMNGTVQIVTSSPGGGPGNTDNVLAFISALNANHTFTSNGKTVYTGSFDDCFGNVVNVLASDSKSTQTQLKNYLSVAQDIADERDSLSAVNIDDEVSTMMMYNKALNAAARLMTTYDEMLNTIINGMGIVGR